MDQEIFLILPEEEGGRKENEKQKERNKLLVSKICWYSFLMIIVLFVCGMFTYAMMDYMKDDMKVEEGNLKGYTMILDQWNYISYEKILNGGIDLSLVEKLIVNDSRITHFDTTPFVGLKQLVIDENLKIQSLVVNKSKIVEFSYNSSEILSILMVNNKKMTSFINSNLPHLKNLTIITTDIKIWKQNTFGNLKSLTFQNSQIGQVPILDANITNLSLKNCLNITMETDLFDNLSNLQELQLISTTFSSGSIIIYFNDLRIKSIIFKQINLKSFYLQDCIHLQNVVIDIDKIDEIEISTQYNDNPCSFSIKANQINSLFLQDNYLKQFNIEVKTLLKLSIAGEKIQKIPYKIPGLQNLAISNTLLNNQQFAKINMSSLVQLYLIRNEKLTQLINSFPNLNILYLYQNCNISKLNALQLTLLAYYSNPANIDNITIQGNFDKLQQIRLMSFNATYLNILIKYNKSLVINSLNGINSEACNIFFSSQTNISQLVIKDSKVKIVNQTFQNLGSISIEKTSFTFIQNILNYSQNDFSFKISDTTIQMSENKILAPGQLLLYKINYQNLIQQFPNIRSLSISEVNFLPYLFKDIIELFKNLQVLQFSNSFVSYIQNVNFTKLTDFKFKNSGTKIQSCRFPNLIYLEMSTNSDAPLSYVVAPKLQTIIFENKNANQNMVNNLVNEFEKEKQHGTNINYLKLNNLTNSQKEQIRVIFPNITFL